jgi:hypothetical protein
MPCGSVCGGLWWFLVVWLDTLIIHWQPANGHVYYVILVAASNSCTVHG